MAAFNRGFELETKMREKEARRSVGVGGGHASRSGVAQAACIARES